MPKPYLSMKSDYRSAKGRQFWLDAARDQLVEGGVEQVKVDLIAKKLNVTRGGFYWHFKNREDLLQDLLSSWAKTATSPMLDALEGVDGAEQRFQAVLQVWTDNKAFTRLDAAMRDWARTSLDVAKAIRRVDETRVGLFQKVFEESGLDSDSASDRAKLIYYHQVGYYSTPGKESRAAQQRKVPLLYLALTETFGSASHKATKRR